MRMPSLIIPSESSASYYRDLRYKDSEPINVSRESPIRCLKS